MGHVPLRVRRIPLALRDNTRFPDTVDATLDYIDRTVFFVEAANIHLEEITALNPIIPTGGSFGAFMRINGDATNIVGNEANSASTRITTTDLQVFFDLGYSFERSMAYIDADHARRDFRVLPGREAGSFQVQSTIDFQELYTGSPVPKTNGGFTPESITLRGNSSNRDYNGAVWGRSGFGVGGFPTGAPVGQVEAVPRDSSSSLPLTRPVGVINRSEQVVIDAAIALAENHTGTSVYDSAVFDITGEGFQNVFVQPFGPTSTPQVFQFPTPSIARNYVTQNSAGISIPVFNGNQPYTFRMVFKAAKRPDPVIPAPDAIYNEKLYLPFLSIHNSDLTPTIAQEILGFTLQGTMTWTPVFNIYADLAIGEKATFTDSSGNEFVVDNTQDDVSDRELDDRFNRVLREFGISGGDATTTPDIAPTVAPVAPPPQVTPVAPVRGSRQPPVRIGAGEITAKSLGPTAEQEEEIEEEFREIEARSGVDAAILQRELRNAEIRRQNEEQILNDIDDVQEVREEEVLAEKIQGYVRFQITTQTLGSDAASNENVNKLSTKIADLGIAGFNYVKSIVQGTVASIAPTVAPTPVKERTNQGSGSDDRRSTFNVKTGGSASAKSIKASIERQRDRDRDNDNGDSDAGSAGGGSGPSDGATGYASGATGQGGATGQQNPPATTTTEFAAQWDSWQLVDTNITNIGSAVGLTSSTGELDGIYVVEITFNPNSPTATITTAQYPSAQNVNYYDGLKPENADGTPNPAFRGTRNITVPNDSPSLVVQFGNMNIIHIDALSGDILNKGVN